MYLDEIKQFAKNAKELETLIRAVMIYSDNIGMEFGINICHGNNEKLKMI